MSDTPDPDAPCTCGWPGGTYGTNDPTVRRCDMCGGTVAVNPETGEFLDGAENAE